MRGDAGILPLPSDARIRSLTPAADRELIPTGWTDNDWALGEIVQAISHSRIWSSSLILVLEDDAQDGADHVDAHRISALVISPFARRGAVVRSRYDGAAGFVLWDHRRGS